MRELSNSSTFSQSVGFLKPRMGERGFTLIELMIVLVILAVVLTLVAPGFSSIFLSTRLSNYANEMVSGVYLSRGEAVKRNATIEMCAVNVDGDDCSGTNDWGAGWIIIDDAGNIIRSQATIASDFALSELGGAHTLIFEGSGIVNSSDPSTSPAPFTFKVCKQSPAGHQEREVGLNMMGKVNVRTTETGSCP